MINYKNEISVAYRLLGSSSSGLKTSLAAVSENPHVLLTHAAQLEPFAKSVDWPHSAEVRKVAFLEGETHFSGPSEYPAQSTLLGAFVPRGFWCSNHSFLRSGN